MQCRYLHWVDSDCCAKKRVILKLIRVARQGVVGSVQLQLKRGQGPTSTCCYAISVLIELKYSSGMFPPPPSLTRRLSFFYFCLYFFIERESTYDVRCLVCTVQGMYVLIRMKWYSIGKTYVLLEYRYSIQYTSISHTVLVPTYTGTPSLKFRCTAVLLQVQYYIALLRTTVPYCSVYVGELSDTHY